MIGYVTLGTNNLQQAVAFYDELLAELGATRMMETDTFVAWGVAPQPASLALTIPFDTNAATVGNGTMVALAAQDPEQIERVYKKALSLGATDEGAPGPRGDDGFYAAYFRDPDGNKLNAFCMVSGD